MNSSSSGMRLTTKLLADVEPVEGDGGRRVVVGARDGVAVRAGGGVVEDPHHGGLDGGRR